MSLYVLILILVKDYFLYTRMHYYISISYFFFCCLLSSILFIYYLLLYIILIFFFFFLLLSTLLLLRDYFRGKVLVASASRRRFRAAFFSVILLRSRTAPWANRSQRMGRPVVQYIAGKKGTKYYVCKGASATWPRTIASFPKLSKGKVGRRICLSLL